MIESKQGRHQQQKQLRSDVFVCRKPLSVGAANGCHHSAPYARLLHPPCPRLLLAIQQQKMIQASQHQHHFQMVANNTTAIDLNDSGSACPQRWQSKM